MYNRVGWFKNLVWIICAEMFENITIENFKSFSANISVAYLLCAENFPYIVNYDLHKKVHTGSCKKIILLLIYENLKGLHIF